MRRVAEMESRQILLFVDGLTLELSIENAYIIFLSKIEGYRHLSQKINDGTYDVSGFKLVILLIGHGEVWEPDRQFLNGVDDVIRAIKNQNDHCVIMLGASLPSSSNTRAMINTLRYRNDKLAARCIHDPRLEHTQPGKSLLGSHGPLPDYFDDFGNINKFGGDGITRALERKIFGTKLFQRVEDFE